MNGQERVLAFKGDELTIDVCTFGNSIELLRDFAAMALTKSFGRSQEMSLNVDDRVGSVALTTYVPILAGSQCVYIHISGIHPWDQHKCAKRCLSAKRWNFQSAR